MQNLITQRELSSVERDELGSYNHLLAHLLFHRGVTKRDEAERFLNPNYETDLHDPFLMMNMDKAVDRILSAIAHEEKIVIYGDYDCDGIPGSTILHDFFKKISYKNFYVYIPHRHLEGYGLNIGAINKFADDNVKLLITVDNGITDVEEVNRANEFGIDVIITDHHLPQEKIPKAFAILNSKQADDKYPFNMLCGAGVAFKLVQALVQKWNGSPSMRLGTTGGLIPAGWEKWLLDMAGLSTIADMVPLQGENRVLAYFGLKVLQRSSRPGLQKLLSKAKVNQSVLTEEDIGFTIGPRINAASRMGEPIYGFKLLSTRDEVESGIFADYLEQKNNERKRVVSAMMKEIDKIMQNDQGSAVIVVGNKEWAPGVVGLAAGKIADKYKRPAFVWGKEGASEIKGSCRSDGLVNIVDLMVASSENLFLGMGGHALAGGFSVSEDNVGKLEEALSRAYIQLRESSVSSLTDEVVVDKKIDIDDVTISNCELINKMAPFGTGNKKPIFLLEGLEIAHVNFFGSKQDHLRLDFKNSWGEVVSAILFYYKEKCKEDLSVGDLISMIAHMEIDTFGYKPRARLRIVDIHKFI